MQTALGTLEQIHRTETVSKGWEIHPAAAFNGLNPAGQVPGREGFIMFQNFL